MVQQLVEDEERQDLRVGRLAVKEDIDHDVLAAVLVRLAAWFGISAPAALARLVQADVIPRLERRRELARLLTRGQHTAVEHALGVNGVGDALSRIAREGRLPRLPALMHEHGLAAYQGGLIDLDRLSDLLGRARDELERLVGELGLTPAEPVADW